MAKSFVEKQTALREAKIAFVKAELKKNIGRGEIAHKMLAQTRFGYTSYGAARVYVYSINPADSEDHRRRAAERKLGKKGKGKKGAKSVATKPNKLRTSTRASRKTAPAKGGVVKAASVAKTVAPKAVKAPPTTVRASSNGKGTKKPQSFREKALAEAGRPSPAARAAARSQTRSVGAKVAVSKAPVATATKVDPMKAIKGEVSGGSGGFGYGSGGD